MTVSSGIAQASKVYEALKQAIETGPWQANPLLGAMGKELQVLKDQFEKALAIHPEWASNAEVVTQDASQEVFISLYQAQGDNLYKWQNMLSNLSELSISRPVYQQEAHVQSILPTGDRARYHAYVVVKLNPEDVLKPHDNRFDREGYPLVTLKEGAIKSENIVRFVHASGEYKWVHNFLVKQPITQSKLQEGT